MPIGTVIIVPGVTGSSISYPFGLAFASEVWVNPAALVAGGFPNMRLPIPAENDPGPKFQASQGGPPLPYYYGTLASYLRVRGYRVVWPQGDWRKPQAFDAVLLLALIRAEAKSRPVNIVCHSRGGLLTRRALGALATTNDLGMIRRVVGLGVPHTGSLNAAAYVSGDANEQKLCKQLARIFPGTLLTSYLVKTLTAVTRSWAAMYELMPKPGASWMDGATINALYDVATWEPSHTTPVAAYLSAAKANWSIVPAVPEGVDWIDVVGAGIPTATSIDSLEELAREGSINTDGDGDGTVPVASAGDPARPRVTTPTAHASLIIDPRVWDAVYSVLPDGLKGNITLGGPTLNL